MPILKPASERFYEKIMADPNSGCWLWTGAITSAGYGQISIGGHLVYAHRFSYEHHTGKIPPGNEWHGICVLHKCDTPPCVNPAHLFLGTIKDNHADMIAKGRVNRSGKRCGSRHPRTKLSETQVLEILDATGKMQEIGDRYGVSGGIVSLIKSRKTWRHLGRL